MQLHTHLQPEKIIQMPNLIVILYEAQAGVRQVFMMDARCQVPTRSHGGTAIWLAIDDTLVVETNGFRDDVAGCRRQSADQHRK